MKDINIESLLPHRRPFLFVDDIIFSTDEGSESTYTFKEDELFFAGHFPKQPIVPGVILIETMAQAGGAALVHINKIGKDKLFFLASISKAKFKKMVFPNVQVRIKIKNLRVSQNMIRQEGTILIGAEVAAEAEWMCLVNNGVQNVSAFNIMEG